MAKVVGRRTQVFLNGVDLSSHLNNMEAPGQADSHETTAFGAQDKTFIAGLRSGTMRLGGWFDAATDGSDEEFQAALGQGAAGTADVILCCPVEPEIDKLGVAGSCVMTSYGRTSPVAGVVSVSADFQASGGLDPVRNVYPKGTLTASVAGGTTAAYNGGTATAQGAIGYLQVFGVSGTPVVAIDHSATGTSGWAALITFAAKTAAGAERKAVTGTVQPYLRTTVTGGTATCWTGINQPIA